MSEHQSLNLNQGEAFMAGLPQDAAHLRERIDWPYIVNFGILRLFSIMSEKEVFPFDNVDNLTKFLERLIPSIYRETDAIYKAAIMKATQRVPIDLRTEFCGVKLTIEWCVAQGIPHTELINYLEPVDRFGAIVDLFQRLNALLKLDRVEVFTGQTWAQFQAEIVKQEAEFNAEADTPNPTP